MNLVTSEQAHNIANTVSSVLDIWPIKMVLLDNEIDKMNFFFNFTLIATPSNMFAESINLYVA